jgi:predicted HicB family RNase H-like nuclease
MKKSFEYKGYTAKIAYSYEDEIFHGKINGIIDLVTFEGSSVAELKEAFRDAVEDYLDICKRMGKEPDKEYKGSFNVRISPELHKRATIKAAQDDISLNQLIEDSISSYLAPDRHVSPQNINVFYSCNALPESKAGIAKLWVDFAGEMGAKIYPMIKCGGVRQ